MGNTKYKEKVGAKKKILVLINRPTTENVTLDVKILEQKYVPEFYFHLLP